MFEIKIRVVLDTSVLISALKTKNPKRSPAWRVLKALRTGEITNFISREIAEEMQEKVLVIGDEVGKPNVADYILTLVLSKSIVARPRRKFSNDPEFLKNLKDPNDAKFFDVAYAKRVDYIISENTKHIIQMRDETSKTYHFNGRKVKILRAGEFVREALR